MGGVRGGVGPEHNGNDVECKLHMEVPQEAGIAPRFQHGGSDIANFSSQVFS